MSKALSFAVELYLPWNQGWDAPPDWMAISWLLASPDIIVVRHNMAYLRIF